MQRKTPSLLLREFEESDWKAVQAYQSDLLYTRYHAWEQPTEPEAREFVGRFVAQQREGHFREKEFFKTRWWDSLLYAILEHEWQSQSSTLVEPT